MEKVRLIGFAGYAGVGKDTAAELLGMRKLPFAAELKRQVQHMIANTSPEANTWLLKNAEDGTVYRLTREAKDRFRPIFVCWGNWVRDNIDPDYWTTAWAKQYDSLAQVYGDGFRCAATDVRYANEARAVRARGGIIVRVCRPGFAPACPEEERSLEGVEEDIAVLNPGDTKENFLRVLRDKVLPYLGG